MAGVGGADSSSGGGASSGAGSNSNSSGSAGKNDSNKNDKSSKSSGSDKSESKGSKGSDKGSFDRAMSDAQNKTDGGNDKNKTEAEQQAQETGQSKSRDRVSHFSGLSRSKDMQQASRQHADEFAGLGPTGNASLNSHRGYGPDDTKAGETKQATAAQKTDATDLVGPVGFGAAGFQAGVDAVKSYKDYSARRAAANTLTKGNAGNLPAGLGMSRADLAKDLTNTRSNVGKALSETPFGPNAKSTQQLSAAVKPTSTLGAVSKGIGFGLQPAAGAVQGYINTPEDASWSERMTNTVLGAVKEIDDTALSYGAGFAAASATVAVSPLTGPAAPAVAIVGAPSAGFGAAVAAGSYYNDSPLDRGIDSAVEFSRPAVEFGFEKIEEAAGLVKEGFDFVADSIDQWEENVSNRALNETKNMSRNR